MKLSHFTTTYPLAKALAVKTTSSTPGQVLPNPGEPALFYAFNWKKNYLNFAPTTPTWYVVPYQMNTFNMTSLVHRQGFSSYEVDYLGLPAQLRVKKPLFHLLILQPCFWTNLTSIIISYRRLRSILTLYLTICNTRQLLPDLLKPYHQGFYERQMFSSFNIRYL